MRGNITDAPHLTVDNFVDHLTSDLTLVHFFNEFLSLPSFPEALTYNQETGMFEVVSEAAESVSRTITLALRLCRSKPLSDPSELTAAALLDNHYTVLCLDREQGLQWIVRERLPFFIQSDCYFEYRLAKLLSQRDPGCERRRRQGAPPRATPEPQPPSRERDPPVYLTEPATTQHCLSRDCKSHNPPCGLLEDVAARVVEAVLRDVRTAMGSSCGLSQLRTEATHECSSQSGESTALHTASPCGRGFRPQEGLRGRSEQERDLDGRSHSCGFHGSRQGLEELKEFLQGTPGEKLVGLWMDIERLRALQDEEKKNRHVTQMRQRYLLSAGDQSRLSAELLSRLGLATAPCWREDKLHLIQPCVSQALLRYWVPRFLSAQSAAEDREESGLSLQEKRQLRPASGIDPWPRYITLHPLRPDTCVPAPLRPGAHPQPGEASSSVSPVLGGSRMERMLQALYVDSRAGYLFTSFCERSGNQLWENAALFWRELQQYHQLFYQDGLDPYRVQRLAQLLYSSYLSVAARRGVGVDEESRRQVHRCLSPPFEELFDGVEEHVLTLLLEPWSLMVSRDMQAYQRVCVCEETRQVDSEQYSELQTLYQQAESRGRQVQQQKCSSPARPPEGHRSPSSWANVPERYRGYRLGSLLRHHMELHHFMTFLQDNAASMHLTCWLDMEQLRRTPQKDKVSREEKTKHIKTKYLNRKYFFGPGSPASSEQQDDVLRLAGGWARLQHNTLPALLLVDIQNIIRSFLETEWLPLFLATPQFSERQARKPQTADSASDQGYRRHRKKREAWEADGAGMSSSKEVLALRRALLHPVTSLQFQLYVSLKGDFLENDVLFWLEVQRYKDLCHSHSDEVTVQNKVSTIIGCFLQSSIPPALQIDVPPEQAQCILDRRRELGPYVFREAQMSVFGELLKLWPQFQVFRSSVEEEEVLPLLEERRRKQRDRFQRRRRRDEEEEEERRDQEETERRASAFTEQLFEEEDGERGEEDRQTREDRRTRWLSRELALPGQQMSWSYSRYMTALEREELLLKRQMDLGIASFSTTSDSSSGHSVKSEGSRRKCSIPSPRATPRSDAP